jgi:hypothetical protein
MQCCGKLQLQLHLNWLGSRDHSAAEDHANVLYEQHKAEHVAWECRELQLQLPSQRLTASSR